MASEIKVPLEAVKQSLETAHEIFREMEEDVDKMWGKFYSISEDGILTGASMEAFVEFLSIIDSDVISTTQVFNEKMFIALNSIVVQFEQEEVLLQGGS